MNGWIKLNRSITEWEWYKVPNTKDVFIHLLLTANIKVGRFQGLEIKRGQVATGRKQLAYELGLTEMQIRTAINHLISTSEISINVTNKFSIVTICKYDYYQSENLEDNQQNNQRNNQQVTNKQPTNNQQITTIKEEKEYKKEINKESEEDIKKSLKDFGNALLETMPQRCQAIMMNNKLTKDDLIYYLNRFCFDCLAIGKKHIDVNDFVSHFVNWLPTGKKKYEKTSERPEMEKFKQYGVY